MENKITEEMLKAVESVELRRTKSKCRMRAYQELSVLHKEEFKELLKKEYEREGVK